MADMPAKTSDDCTDSDGKNATHTKRVNNKGKKKRATKPRVFTPAQREVRRVRSLDWYYYNMDHTPGFAQAQREKSAKYRKAKQEREEVLDEQEQDIERDNVDCTSEESKVEEKDSIPSKRKKVTVNGGASTSNGSNKPTVRRGANKGEPSSSQVPNVKRVVETIHKGTPSRRRKTKAGGNKSSFAFKTNKLEIPPVIWISSDSDEDNKPIRVVDSDSQVDHVKSSIAKSNPLPNKKSPKKGFAIKNRHFVSVRRDQKPATTLESVRKICKKSAPSNVCDKSTFTPISYNVGAQQVVEKPTYIPPKQEEMPKVQHKGQYNEQDVYNPDTENTHTSECNNSMGVGRSDLHSPVGKEGGAHTYVKPTKVVTSSVAPYANNKPKESQVLHFTTAAAGNTNTSFMSNIMGPKTCRHFTYPQGHLKRRPLPQKWRPFIWQRKLFLLLNPCPIARFIWKQLRKAIGR